MYEEKQKIIRKKNRRIQTVLITLALLVPAVWMTINVLQTQGIVCKVCVSYNGLEQCKEATGPSLKECSRTAIDNACAFISSGMTEVMACTTQADYDVKQMSPQVD